MPLFTISLLFTNGSLVGFTGGGGGGGGSGGGGGGGGGGLW